MAKQRALVIAEKPSVARAIEAAYNKIRDSYSFDLTITSARGHLLELYDPEDYRTDWGKPWTDKVLPMIPSEWKTKVIKESADVLQNIKNLYSSGNFDFIINSGDPAEEGCLIQYLIYEYLGVNIPIYRLWADDVTESTLIKALNNLRPDKDYEGYTKAGLLRQHLDWLVGMNFSRGVSLALDRFSRVGRVMTAVLGMIVRREYEIQNFIPKPFYQIESTFRTMSGHSYDGYLLNAAPHEELSNPYGFLSKSEVDNIIAAITPIREAMIISNNTEDKKSIAPALFSLADLQKECALRFGYDATKTLELTQFLYEKGYVSYPRTESKCITKAQIEDIPATLAHIRNNPELKLTAFIDDINADINRISNTVKSKKYVDDSKVSDHPAITPTTKACDVTTLTDEQRNVYESIVKRFVAIFLPPQIKTVDTIETVIPYKSEKYPSGFIFRSRSTTIKDKGWKLLYADDVDDDDDVDKIELPKVFAGENATKEENRTIVGETNPPKRYNDATIITAMETAGRTLDDEELQQVLKDCAGLGTAATRGEILKKLETSNYVIRKGGKTKQFIPTQIGADLINALGDRQITSPIFTAEWQRKLTMVKRGEMEYEAFEKEMVAYVSQEVQSFHLLPKLGPYSEVLGKCPICKTRNFITSQRSQKYAYCEGYAIKDEDGSRACSFILPFSIGKNIELSKKDLQTLIEKGQLKPRAIKTNSGYKSVRVLALGRKEDGSVGIVFKEADALGKCPFCADGEIKIGEKSYYCTNYKGNISDSKCDFAISRKIGKTSITPEQFKQVLENGRTKNEVKVQFANGKSYKAPLRLGYYENHHALEFVPYESENVCKCPNCIDGQIITEKFYYACTNHKVGNCRVKFGKEAMGAAISMDEAKTLLNGGSINKMVKFKDGKTAIKDLYLVFDEAADRYAVRYKTNFTNKQS